jgi:DegV family protein with EDD domain
MRIGIVVDSACDLPAEFIRRHGIEILPQQVRIGDALLRDRHDDDERRHCLASRSLVHERSIETLPPTVDDVRRLLLERWVIDYDHLFCLTTSGRRSRLHHNVMQAGFAILNDYHPLRQAAGHASPFALRVIDTHSLSVGQGITAHEAVRLRGAGESVARLRARLELLAAHTYAYVVPRDPRYLAARSQDRIERGVGMAGAIVGDLLDMKPLIRAHRGTHAAVAMVRGFESAVRRLFDFTRRRIESGLLAPVLCVGYGGELSELRALPGHEALRNACIAAGVVMTECSLSLTSLADLGYGALGVGFAAGPHAFDDGITSG